MDYFTHKFYIKVQYSTILPTSVILKCNIGLFYSQVLYLSAIWDYFIHKY